MLMIKKLVCGIIASLILISNIRSMKETQKITQIKDHEIIIFSIKDYHEIIIPESLVVTHAPFLEQKNISDKIIPIDTKRIAFFNGSSTKIWSMSNGEATMINKKTNPACKPLMILSNNNILFANENGGFTIWDFEKNSNKKFRQNGENKITNVLQLSRTKIVTLDQKGIMNLWDIESSSLLKSISGKPGTFLFQVSKNKLLSNYEITIGVKSSLEFIVFWDLENGKCEIKQQRVAKIINFLVIPDQIEVFDFNADDCHCSLYVEDYKNNKHYKIRYQGKDIKFLSYLPKHNAIMYQRKTALGYGVGAEKINKITFLDLKDAKLNKLHIDVRTFLERRNDIIVSMTYHEKENAIMIITDKGFIITITCVDQKNQQYLFQNLKKSIKQKKFKDCSFNFT